MTTYTDEQPKRTLAKMLPENIHLCEGPCICMYDNNTGKLVLDTELLHLCWLVEKELSDTQWIVYSAEVETVVNDFSPRYKFEIHTTWQQKVVSLAKVKGIEIV